MEVEKVNGAIMELERLDFGFSPHDDMLEATFPGGYIDISYNNMSFHVIGNYHGASINLGVQHKTIYDALDAANQWWGKCKSSQ